MQHVQRVKIREHNSAEKHSTAKEQTFGQSSVV